MAALVPAGAPVSVLIDHSLAEDIVEKLLEAGVGTVEQLGSMTPEELEAIPSIGSGIVEKILIAVNGYYAQFEQPVEMAEIADEALPEDEIAVEEVVTDAETLAAGNGSEAAETGHVPGANAPDEKKEFDTIENSEGVR